MYFDLDKNKKKKNKKSRENAKFEIQLPSHKFSETIIQVFDSMEI